MSTNAPLETPMLLTGMVRLWRRGCEQDTFIRADTVIRVLPDHNRDDGRGAIVWVRGSESSRLPELTEHPFITDRSVGDVLAEVAQAMAGMRRHAELMRVVPVALPSAGPASEAVPASTASASVAEVEVGR